MLRTLDFRERTKLRRALYAKPTILVIVAIASVSLSGAWNMYQKSKEAKANDDKANATLSALQTREAGLRSDIERLSTPRGQEEEIRDRFMVAKEGEKVIIITPPKDDTVHTVTVPEDEKRGFLDSLKAAVGLSGGN